MNFKRGLGIITVAMAIAFVDVFAHIRGWISWDSMTSIIFVTIAACVIVSVYLFPGLMQTVSTEQSMFNPQLSDELDDIKNMRMTRPIVLFFITLASTGAYLWALAHFHKFTDAKWFGSLPVGVITILLAVLMAFIGRRTRWFNNTLYRTPNKAIAFVLLSSILAFGLGLYMTEATPYSQGESASYHYNGTRAHHFIYYTVRSSDSGYHSSGGSSSNTQCGKGCGEGVLFLLVVLLAIILIVGSALIPHFWVLAVGIFLVMEWIILLQEARRDRKAYSYGYGWRGF